MSIRLTRIEGEMLRDHAALNVDDECYFLYEYTSQRGFDFSKTNSLIVNLKKPPTFRTRPDVWKHKIDAIEKCARSFQITINPNYLRNSVLVPIPPSKVKNDPLYDSRMRDILDRIDTGFCDIRELVIQRSSMRASHSSDERPSIDDLAENYVIDERLAEHCPDSIAIFDDILTVGNHFKAMSRVLKTRFPNSKICGFFVARRVFPPDTIDDFENVAF